MAKRSHAANQTTSPDPTDSAERQPNLIELEAKSPAPSLPNELNSKIGKIDADLDDLRSELSKTNRSVKHSLTHLSDKGSDLTSKVSETYQQLGALDEAYKSLSDKSATISKDIKAISKQIDLVSDKSDTDIGLLSEAYQALIMRTDELAKKSKQTTQTLNKSIKDNAKTLRDLENALVSEIDNLARSSKERDETLANKSDEISTNLSRAEEEIRSNQARMLKLQAVDQAIENRVSNVEATATELTKKSGELARSTTALNKLTTRLSEAVEELQARMDEHGDQISDLQDRVERGARALVSLIMVEKRHFRLLGGTMVLLLVALFAFMGYQTVNWRSESQINTALQSDLGATAAQLTATQSELGELGDQARKSHNAMQDELAGINDRLVAIGDQVDTLDGRVTNMRPYRGIGNDNTIHGSDWITKQPASNHTIHLATVSEKQELYKLAERYHSYLKDELAYLPVTAGEVKKYALIYGNYTALSEAESVLSRLPQMIERHRPSLHTMQQVQSFIVR
jgi:DNA repair exonuclease SbcCD ATPase subunit